MAQESLALFAHLEQPLPQPFDLPAQRLEVGGAFHLDRLGKLAMAELADGVVDVPDGPPEEQGEYEGETETDRHQGSRLPQQAPARPLRVVLKADQLAVDLATREHGELAAGLRQRSKAAQRRGDVGALGRFESGRDGRGLAPQFVDQAAPARVARQAFQRGEDRVHAPPVLVEYVQQLGASEQLEEARAALHGRDLSHDRLRITRGLHAMQDQPLARRGQARDVEGRADHARQQRHGNERESEQDQAAERTRSRESHGRILAAGQSPACRSI